MFQGKNIELKDFSGGYCGNIRFDQLKNNQALTLNNIVVYAGGAGFRLRDTSTKLTGTALNSNAAVYGLGIINRANSTPILIVVAGNKIFFNDTVGTTFTDKTGLVTVSTGTYKYWSLFPFNDKIVAFGGVQNSPDVPWEIATTGSDAAILTGTPPAAFGGLAANNRVFAFCTSAAPSTMYWSVLANENDWTGVGSGSVVIGSSGDGEPITAAIMLNTNTMLVFKQSKIYQMVLTAAPFPHYLLFDGIGAPGKNCVVAIDGTVYWVGSDARMHSTTGTSVQSYPNHADDLWSLSPLGIAGAGSNFIHGFRQKGADYDWLVWITEDAVNGNYYAIIWDLLNKCWLRNSTGYDMRASVRNNTTNIVYAGTFSGNVGTLGTSTLTDALSSGNTPNPSWRSGWIQPATADEIIQPSRFTLNCSPTSATITLTYGFNFIAFTKSTTIPSSLTSTEVGKSTRVSLTGRGNYFQFDLAMTGDGVNNFKVSSCLLSGKVYGQKRLSAS